MIDYRLLLESAVVPFIISVLLYIISPQMLPLEAYVFFVSTFTLIVYLFIERFRINQQEEMERLRQKYVEGEIDVSEFEESIEGQVEKET